MIKYFNGFFEDKKILITGHTGFIGSWLSILLNELGAKVIGYALPPLTKKDNYVVSNLDKKIINIIGEIKDFENLKGIFKKYDPEIIYHLAAQPIVRKSYKFPRETYETNIMGTVNVLENFRKFNSKILINFTTDKVYKNLELNRGYNEEDRLGGEDPYSSSKVCSEIITSAYYNSYFKTIKQNKKKIVSTVRCGNVIGGGDWQEDRLIPDFMRAIKSNKEMEIRNPNHIRPWQFVLEPLRGFLKLTKKMWNYGDEFSSSWNFGPNNDEIFTVKELIDKIIENFGQGHYKVTQKNQEKILHESKILMLNIEKAQNLLGWHPILTMDETIKYICDWYKNENINYDFDVGQIESYFKKVKD